MGLNATAGMRPPASWAGALLFVGAVVLCWTVLPAVLQTVPHADNVEQLNWAHALQWGYLKHPPLPTALLWSASALFGPSAILTYALAMACVGASLLLIWRCALLLAGPPTALVALFLASTNYYLMGRGSFLNHNTVMLPFVAASALLVLRIVQDAAGPTAWRRWVLLGLVQALGLLTKYQMAIVIAANAAALLAAVPWRRAGHAGPFVRNAALCTAATALPLLPHLAWLRAHDFSTFAYAGQNLLADLPLGQRLLHTASFTAQQVGRLAPVGLTLALALLLQRRWPSPAAPPAEAPPTAAADAAGPAAPELFRALWLLALVPGLIVLALALVAGVAPQNHWGATSTVLLPLALAVRLPPARRPMAGPALAATLAVHALAILWNVTAAFTAPGFHHSFAARPLAAQSLAYWQAHAAGPLRIVVGPDCDAGAIALDLPSHPAVIASGDRRQAPWVSDAQLAGCGALVLWRPDQPPSEQVGAFAAALKSPVILEAPAAHGGVSRIAAGILEPTAPHCPEPAP